MTLSSKANPEKQKKKKLSLAEMKDLGEFKQVRGDRSERLMMGEKQQESIHEFEVEK